MAPSDKQSVACIQCGMCCLADMIAYVTDEDMNRWRRDNREDILHVIERESAVWMGDHLVSSTDGHYIGDCPFLVSRAGTFSCSIYETRPRVCRDYEPASSQLCSQYVMHTTTDPG